MLGWSLTVVSHPPLYLFRARLPNCCHRSQSSLLHTHSLVVHHHHRGNIMLQRAVEKHQPTKISTGNKSAGERSSAHQTTINNAFKSPQPFKSTPPQTTSPNQSSAPSTGNTTIMDNSSVARKRLLDTNDSLVNTLNNITAFRENTCVSSDDTQANSHEALHSLVYFEEDDFDDDDELEFTSEDIIPSDLKAAASSLTSDSSLISDSPEKSVRLPTPPEVIDLEAPESSGVPIPWSSSPISHFQPLRPAQHLAASRLLPTKVHCQEGVSQQRKQELSSTSKLNPPKKLGRSLPNWAASNAAASVPTAATICKSGRKFKTDAVSKPQVTPDSKREYSRHAWDPSFSAIQAAKKEFKATTAIQKRSISTIAVKEQAPSKKPRIGSFNELMLSDEQRSVVKLVVQGGKSVFFTGSAGTGKSVLMREIIKQLRIKHNETERIAVTASTGLAACNVGGVTLHSFGGIGLGREAPADLVRKIKKNAKARQRWLRTKVLIMDEISMVDGELFDKLEAVARMLRNNGRPFGGIQLVITGDFFQLPPVPDFGRIQKFAFEADTWNTCIEHTIRLTHVFRQKDPAFAAVLDEMRLGNLSAESCELFKRLSRPLQFNDGLEATELFSTRQEVDKANSQRMAQLPGEVFTYYAEDGGTITDKVQRDKLLSSCMAPARLDLKIDAQVMLIKNMDESLVNGSLGRIVGFMNEKTFELSENGNMRETSGLDESNDVLDDQDALVKRQKRIKAKILELQAADTSIKWPLVQFTIADGTIRQLLVQPESWKIELPNGEVQAQRNQLPLILAWALSIHKAQGQTLERVKVDLGKVFEKGQAYVALSRATCQEGLQVMRFDKSKVQAHDKVRQFYDSLYSVKDAHKRTRLANTIVPAKPVEYLESDEEALEYSEGAL